MKSGMTTEKFAAAARAARAAGKPLSQVQERTLAKVDRARLAELDAAWDRHVATVTEALFGKPGDHRVVTQYRNQEAKRRRRKGLGPLEPVSSEIRRRAEALLLSQIAAGAAAGNALALRLQADLDEWHELQAAVSAQLPF